MTQPRELLHEPSLFGKQKEVAWRSDFSLDDLAAAELQHRCSFEMRKEIRRKFATLKKYCQETGQSYQRVGQVLRGTVVINGADIGAATAHLGITLDFLDEGKAELAAATSIRDAVGAFYTPEDVSKFMVEKVSIAHRSRILEPSFGDGSFLRALKALKVSDCEITACEIDPAACSHALNNDLVSEEQIFRGSFFDLSNELTFDAAIGNPPYVRLRALAADERRQLISLSESILGSRVGEEGSEWMPFLLKSANHLRDNGALAFVLPFDFTYVKYARDVWRYLGDNFSTIEVMRSKQRIFEEILQDVILVFARGKGGRTNTVSYTCYETRSDLLEGKASINGEVSIEQASAGERAFQRAMIDKEILSYIETSKLFVRANEEADLHIGYVCGNKNYFHPDASTIKQFSMPSSSLHNSVVSSRQLGKTGLKSSSFTLASKLWLPEGELTPGEERYVAYGQASKVNEGYKCRVRNPWWKVPGVKVPEAIVSVFGEAPRVVLNDDGWTFSNSLLGAYIKPEIIPEAFCLSWYSSLTLLSIELEVHSLGGGVLVAVPRETGKVRKIAAGFVNEALADEIDAALKDSDVVEAYRVGDKLLSELIGEEMTNKIISAYEILRSWRGTS